MTTEVERKEIQNQTLPEKEKIKEPKDYRFTMLAGMSAQTRRLHGFVQPIRENEKNHEPKLWF